MNYGSAMDDSQTPPDLTNEQWQLSQDASSEHPPRNSTQAYGGNGQTLMSITNLILQNAYLASTVPANITATEHPRPNPPSRTVPSSKSIPVGKTLYSVGTLLFITPLG